MASKNVRIRAQVHNGLTEVKCLMSHIMETGLRKNKETGKLIPAHHITDVTCALNGATVLTAHWGPAVSQNPYLSFMFKGGKPGDTVRISWVDNKGEDAFGEAEIAAA